MATDTLPAPALRPTGWRLDRPERDALLTRFPPRFTDVVADHVTLASRKDGERPLPQPTTGHIVGRVDDGAGVEALVVAIDGTTDRPDGSSYHITWSLDRAAGRRAVESNAVIHRLGWTPIDPPVPVTLAPGVL